MPRKARSPSIRPPAGVDDARGRVLNTAYELFSRYGIRAVGIDRIIAEAGVAKMSLYRHFPSKEDLVLAYLALRDERWTQEWLEAEINRLPDHPRDRLLALFDVLDAWFRRRDYEGCGFLRTLYEVPQPDDPIHAAVVRDLDVIRLLLEEHARAAGVRAPDQIAYQFQILMMGAMTSALRGDTDAARRARGMAEILLSVAT